MRIKPLSIKIGHIDEQAVKPVHNYADYLLRFRWFDYLIEPFEVENVEVVKFEESVICPYCGTKLVLESKQEDVILINKEELECNDSFDIKSSIIFRLLIIKSIIPSIFAFLICYLIGCFAFFLLPFINGFFYSLLLVIVLFFLVTPVICWVYLRIKKTKSNLKKGIILRYVNPQNEEHQTLENDNGVKLITSVKIKNHLPDRKHFLVGNKRMDALSWPDKTSVNAIKLYSEYSRGNVMNFNLCFWI